MNIQLDPNERNELELIERCEQEMSEWFLFPNRRPESVVCEELNKIIKKRNERLTKDYY